MSSPQNYINERIIKLSEDILNYLKTKSQTTTSWELKMHFKIPSSILYMSLGYLLSIGKINIAAENLIYKIEPNLPHQGLNSSDVKDNLC